MLSARFLPGASLSDGEAPVTGPASQRHPLALLAVLASYPRREVRRDKLLSLLWPERDTHAARHLLSEALYALRHVGGKAAIVSVGDGVALEKHYVWTDVAAFRQAHASGDLISAVEVYQGPFLDGFHLDASPEFEDWQHERRQYFDGMYEESLYALADAAEEEGDAMAAARWLRLRLAQSPFSSHATHRLMRMLVRTGDRAEALLVARGHADRLERELGIAPSPCVSNLQEALASGGDLDPSLLKVCGVDDPRCS